MTRAFHIGLILIAASAAAQSTPATADERVDLLLVLAADVSRSMDDPKFRLQRSGYVEALTNPRVIEAIQSGSNRRIAVSFVEWSGVVSQKVVIDWTTISDETTARRFADGLVEAPRSFADRTSISAGIDFAMAQFERAPYEGLRRTIDVSGDGTNNSGRDVTAARDEAVAKGVTVNGLVILSDSPTPWNPEHTNPPGGLAQYYRNNVVGGPGAFVMVAENFKSFGNALINKLIAEIAQARHPIHASLR
jgi:hypothetical protein